MNDLADLAELDEELRRVGGDDEDVGVGLDEDAGLFFVGLAELVAGGDGFRDAVVEVGGFCDAEAVGAAAAEVGEVVGLSGLEAVDGLGEHEGEGVLPCPAGAGEDHGLGDVAGADGFTQAGDGGGVAVEVAEAHGLSLAEMAEASQRVSKSACWLVPRIESLRRRVYSLGMSGVETEIKFRVGDAAELAERLAAAGLRVVTPRSFEANVLYDWPGRELRARTEIVRIRTYAGRCVLTHKRLPDAGPGEDRHKHRVETETEVADGDALAEVFRSLGLVAAFRYEKWRTEWSDGKGHCVVDETPIGNYAELEGEPEWIDAVAARLGLTERDYITLSYGRSVRAVAGGERVEGGASDVCGGAGVGRGRVSESATRFAEFPFHISSFSPHLPMNPTVHCLCAWGIYGMEMDGPGQGEGVETASGEGGGAGAAGGAGDAGAGGG